MASRDDALPSLESTFLPLSDLDPSNDPPQHQPILASVAFFIGSWFTFIAIQRGDVSLVTPLMGSKVIFVALLAVALSAQIPSTTLVIAAVLSAVGIAIMGAKDFAHSTHAALTVALALTSAAVFASKH